MLCLKHSFTKAHINEILSWPGPPFLDAIYLLSAYTLFHVNWITLDFIRNQLGKVSALFIISMPQSNQHVREIISKKSLSNGLTRKISTG